MKENLVLLQSFVYPHLINEDENPKYHKKMKYCQVSCNYVL
jgi:hypothetical protein